jgi:hypothetical protein
MKFVHYLDKIQGVNVYALTAFGIFALVFIGALVHVFSTDKATLQNISRIPLD